MTPEWKRNFYIMLLEIKSLKNSPLISCKNITLVRVSDGGGWVLLLMMPCVRASSWSTKQGAMKLNPRNSSCALALGGMPGESVKLKQLETQTKNI